MTAIELSEQNVMTVDRDAFGSIVTEYASRMKSLGYQMLGDAHLAEDVVQETFLRAYANRGTLHENSNIGGWLYTIAYRISIDYKRKGRKEFLPFDDTLPAAFDDTPEHAALRKESRDTLWKAVDSVGEAYQLPLILFYQYDWPLQQIADHLRLSVPAVKSRLHRSKKVLRTKLTPV